MILDSWNAALLFLAVVAGYWALPGDRWRRPFLAAASFAIYLLFAGWGGLWMALPALAAFAAVRAIAAGRRAVFAPAVVAILAMLFVFKYLNNWGPAAAIVAPLGISYLSFQAIYALLEARRGRVGATGGGAFFSWFFFLPTTAAGPIKSLQRFLANSPTPRWPAPDDLGAGAARIAQGLAKKIVLAESCAPLAAGFAHPAQATALELWIAVYAYALQIYFDFSGYTDMAVGMARLLGYRIEENFSWPYLKTNLRDFWRAWHMSLTGFMREAVYIPLGGNRAGEARLYRNLIVVFALIGLWHGGQSHYLLWGLYHGIGMAAYRVWRGRLAPRLTRHGRAPVGPILGWALTFHFVAFGWVLFACETNEAARVFWRLFMGWR